MVVALDVGTSSARAALYDTAGRAVPGRFHQVRYQAATSASGAVEHDAARLLEAVTTCLDHVQAGCRPGEVLGVGVTSFWHGLLGFDAHGRPATPVYMWADTRSAPEADLLRSALDEPALHSRTGCHVHASYWPAKLRWLARTRPQATREIARWGSIGEHLELTLFGEAATSVSMASGTGLLDQTAVGWDPEALAAAGLSERHLFPLVDRTVARRELRPAWTARWQALRGAAWFPAVGDGAASNVGSGCLDPSRIALNLGTSAALRVTRDDAPPPPRGLWRYRIDRRRALLGGATSEGGNVFAWCREVLRLPPDDALDTALGTMPADGHGLTVLPHLAGERAPGWRSDRRAVVAGLRLDTTALDILRAALEAVALRLAVVYDLLAPFAAREHAVVASGGAPSRVWTQIVADALGHRVTWAPDPEATSRGAALLALEALGVRPDLGAPAAAAEETFEPDPVRHARYQAARERQRGLDERV